MVGNSSKNNSQIETLLESVEQFISDEDKIVTYEFLSQTTGIHVNLAKSVLEKYAEKSKKKSKFPIQVVYSVGGYVGKNLKFLLVTDTKLEQAKAKLDKVLYSHVYSVQKGKLASYGLLYNSNFTDLKKSIQQCSGYSGISCPSVRLKTPEEMKLTKVTIETKKPIETKAPTVKPAAAEASKHVKKEEETSKHVADKKESPKEHKTASKPAADKKAAGKPDMSAFFSKHQVKETKTEPAEKKKEPVEEKKTIVETKRTQASSLKRVARDTSSDDDEDEENKVENSTKKSTVVGNNKRFKLADDDDDFEKHKSKSQPAKIKKAPAKPATKKGKGSKVAEKKPQRKRIQQISDSESESDGGEDDDVMMSSPELAIIPPAPVLDDDDDVMEATIVEDAMPKKTRKLVSKQFMDEDGFIVTKKEFVTCDVEEDETPAPKADAGKKKNESPTKKTESKPPAAKRPSPPGKAKQQSIMNFFTRK